MGGQRRFSCKWLPSMYLFQKLILTFTSIFNVQAKPEEIDAVKKAFQNYDDIQIEGETYAVDQTDDKCTIGKKVRFCI